MGIWVKLKVKKRLEILGKPKQFEPGDWVEVGKQTALKWYLKNEAEPHDWEMFERWLRVLNEPKQRRKPRKKFRMDPLPRVPQVPTPDTFTLFAVPLPFTGKHKIQQDNAIRSWMLLKPPPIIYLFGDEYGTCDACAQFGCIPMPRMERNELKTPIVRDMFMQMQFISAPTDVICYINSDIILFQDFADALIKVKERFDQFLMVSQRWDVRVRYPLEFAEGWEMELRKKVADNDECHGPGAIDYFAFRPGLYRAIPPFAIGRACWDNWLVGHAIRSGADVVDASEVVTTVHQERKGEGAAIITEEREGERERNREFWLADRKGITGTINESNWLFTTEGEIVRRTD